MYWQRLNSYSLVNHHERKNPRCYDLLKPLQRIFQNYDLASFNRIPPQTPVVTCFHLLAI